LNTIRHSKNGHTGPVHMQIDAPVNFTRDVDSCSILGSMRRKLLPVFSSFGFLWICGKKVIPKFANFPHPGISRGREFKIRDDDSIKMNWPTVSLLQVLGVCVDDKGQVS